MTIDEILDAIGAREGYTRQTLDAPDKVTLTGHQETATELERWCAATGLTRIELLNEMGKRLAIEFHDGRATFAFCDMVVNDQFNNIVEQPRPELMWEVFLAFDAGEYNDLEESTVPQIAEIVRKVR
jgi:hypothetical protein